METFADRLQAKILENNSLLCAGIDPSVESLPQFITDAAKQKSETSEQYIYNILVDSYVPSIEFLSAHVACFKINIAFFEQYGIAGLKAFNEILLKIRSLNLVSIVDAKRGDIGTTAQAYSKAFLHPAQTQQNRENWCPDNVANFESDCLTVNPFLGSDTVDVFVQDCKKFSKGLFVLVKTSNTNSDWIQSRVTDQNSVSEHIAEWLAEKSQELMGDCGFSGLGAVVGATYPEQAIKLRTLMPKNFLLIPGFGAQGASAKDALAACSQKTLQKAGLVVNASRALFNAFKEPVTDYQKLEVVLSAKSKSLNQELNSELSA